MLSDADKHAEWLIARGYEVFGGCAWKKGEEGQSRRITEVVKQEAERCIAGAIWEADLVICAWGEHKQRQRDEGTDETMMQLGVQ